MKTLILIQITLFWASVYANESTSIDGQLRRLSRQFGFFDDDDDSDEDFSPLWALNGSPPRPIQPANFPGLGSPVITSLEQVLTTTRQNNAKVDGILKQLSAEKTSLASFHLNLNDIPANLQILPWAYRRIPFVFNLGFLNSEYPIGLRDSAESFEMVDDDDYLSRFPVPHTSQDGTLQYHLQLISDHDDILKLFDISRLEQASQSVILPGKTQKEPSIVPVASSTTGDKENSVLAASPIAAEQEVSVPVKEELNPLSFHGLLTGLDDIRRYRNTRVFNSNGVKVIEAPVLIGPLRLEVRGSSSQATPYTIKVLTRPMKATLSLEETGGQITSLELLATRRMFPHYSQVSLTRSAADGEPDWFASGRWVTHLSLEMQRFWNQGIFIENINKELKNLLAQMNPQFKKKNNSQ